MVWEPGAECGVRYILPPLQAPGGVQLVEAVTHPCEPPAGGSQGGTPASPSCRCPRDPCFVAASLPLLVRTPVITSLQVILIHCDHWLPLCGCSHSLSLR